MLSNIWNFVKRHWGKLVAGLAALGIGGAGILAVLAVLAVLALGCLGVLTGVVVYFWPDASAATPVAEVCELNAPPDTILYKGYVNQGWEFDMGPKGIGACYSHYSPVDEAAYFTTADGRSYKCAFDGGLPVAGTDMVRGRGFNCDLGSAPAPTPAAP